MDDKVLKMIGDHMRTTRRVAQQHIAEIGKLPFSFDEYEMQFSKRLPSKSQLEWYAKFGETIATLEDLLDEKFGPYTERNDSE